MNTLADMPGVISPAPLSTRIRIGKARVPGSLTGTLAVTAALNSRPGRASYLIVTGAPTAMRLK